MNVLDSVVVSVGGSAAILAVIAFLGRSAIQTWLQADLESFKTRLQAEANHSQFKFQKLYDKKLDVISELHELSIKAGEAANYTVRMQGMVSQDEIPGLAEKVTQFKEHYDLRSIWLDDDCCEVIDELLKQHSTFYEAVNMQQLRADNLGKDWIGPRFLELYKQVESDLPAAQSALRKAFHQTLGALEVDASHPVNK